MKALVLLVYWKVEYVTAPKVKKSEITPKVKYLGMQGSSGQDHALTWLAVRSGK